MDRRFPSPRQNGEGGHRLELIAKHGKLVQVTQLRLARIQELAAEILETDEQIKTLTALSVHLHHRQKREWNKLRKEIIDQGYPVEPGPIKARVRRSRQGRKTLVLK